jgi:hypothetical protein
MICEQCDSMLFCPPHIQGPYGRACWLAFGRNRPSPDCDRFVARAERYWVGPEDRRDWRRVKRQARSRQHEKLNG